ncbi:hypothetical protein BDZ45DRAFT_696070 [Acephala macrosclerotiorum]|nr:hypothetical protein BDZ45DRAFT_696070 [Acephala macrosclerotiorum]
MAESIRILWQEKVLWVCHSPTSPKVSDNESGPAHETQQGTKQEPKQEIPKPRSKPDSRVRGISRSSSDVSSDSEKNHVSIASFDILFRDVDNFNEEDRFIIFSPLLRRLPRFKSDTTHPRKEIPRYLHNRRKRSYLQRNRTFKKYFDDDDLYFTFPDDVIDDDGVLMPKLYLNSGISADQEVGCWAKMKYYYAWEDDLAEFRRKRSRRSIHGSDRTIEANISCCT